MKSGYSVEMIKLNGHAWSILRPRNPLHVHTFKYQGYSMLEQQEKYSGYITKDYSSCSVQPDPDLLCQLNPLITQTQR